MGWDANIPQTQFKGKLSAQSFYQLSKAIRERLDAAYLSVPSSLNIDFQKGNVLPKTFFSDFQTSVTSLIPNYANHSLSQSPLVQKYTEASMLTAIGDAARLPAPKSIYTSAAWCYQQYKILNKLRWAVVNLHYYFDENKIFWYEGYDEYVNYQYRYKTLPSGNVTFASGINTLASASWGDWGWESEGQMGRDELGGYFGDWSDGGLYWEGSNLWNFAFNSSNNFTACQCGTSWKRKTSAPFQNIEITLLNLVGSHDQEGFNAVRHDSGAYWEDLTPTTTIYTNENTVTAFAPDEDYFSVSGFIEPSYTSIFYYFRVSTQSALLKLDGANGFTYKDW